MSTTPGGSPGAGPAAGRAAGTAARAAAAQALPGLRPLAGKKRCLVVFIHGFLGSEDSFRHFPEHLAERLAQRHGLDPGAVDAIAFPRYETKGSSQRIVRSLMDWLLLHATSARYESVVLCAHSMGGFLAADAYRYLYRLPVPSDASAGAVVVEDATDGLPPDEVQNMQQHLAQQRSWLGRAASSLSSWFSYNTQDPNAAHPDDLRFLVNIRGIITFDSPFFGLHPNVVTKTGTAKAQAVVATLPETIPQILPSPAAAVDTLIPDKIAVPTPIKDIHMPVSTTWLKAAAKSTLASDKPGSSSQTASAGEAFAATAAAAAAARDTPTGQGSSSFPTWTRHAAVLTAIGAVAAFSGVGLGAVAVAQGVASKMAISGADELYRHAEFLNPLITSRKEQLDRILILQREMEHHHRLYFHGFYLDLINGMSHDSSGATNHVLFDADQETMEQGDSAGQDGADMDAQAPRKARHREPQHFCIPPPASVAHLFRTLSSPLRDEIDAHMNLFDKDNLGHERYEWFLNLVCDEIAKALDFETVTRK
ncbi:hypothetical protein HK105_208399 [Polyrhizophydium stewartii]|uniref:AB hydrolase-1 domain-containing protein n=1 Tax=Polyrhizophydium stewartii TaxID=2732419 RepID=A0ABR4MY24_9FUNG